MTDFVDGEALRSWCLRHQIAYSVQAQAQFGRYLDLLHRYHGQVNLVGYRTTAEIIEGLFIDSLQLLRLGTLPGPLLDVGTGAGFPAIPLKIVCPDLEMILVEPRTKRYAFLQLVRRELGLDGLEVCQAKIESMRVPPLGFAVSKAFAPIREWLSMARPWALQGAQIGCFASRDDWLDAQAFVAARYEVLGIVDENSRIYARLAAHTVAA